MQFIIDWALKKFAGPVLVKIGLALVVALACTAGALTVQTSRLSSAQVAVAAQAETINTLRSEANGLRGDNARWQRIAEAAEQRMRDHIAKAAEQARLDREAAERARREKAEADAVLAKWMDSYAAMVRTRPDCAALEAMELCPVEGEE